MSLWIFLKSLDIVDHDIRLVKLYYYGIRGNALQWLYMPVMKPFFVYQHILSMKSTYYTVPQDSILGPMLFLLYIMDLFNVCKYTGPVLFAYDWNPFAGDTDSHKLQSHFKRFVCVVKSKISKIYIQTNVHTHIYIYTDVCVWECLIC